MEVLHLMESFFHAIGQLIGQFVHLWLSALGLIVVSVLYLIIYVGVVSIVVFFSVFFLIRWIRKRKTKKNAK